MKKVLLFCLAFIALFLASCDKVATGTIEVNTYDNAEKYIAGSTSYKDEINTLNINWISGYVTFIRDDSYGGVFIAENGNQGDDTKVHSYYQDGVLDIQFMKSGMNVDSFDLKLKRLTIYYKEDFKNLNINITSGAIEAMSLVVDKLNINMTSGDAKLYNLTANELNLNFTSGDFNSTINTLKKSEINMTSGDVRIGFLESGATVTVEKTSGNLHFEDYVELEENKYKIGNGETNLLVKLTSGDVTIYKYEKEQ